MVHPILQYLVNATNSQLGVQTFDHVDATWCYVVDVTRRKLYGLTYENIIKN